MGWSHLHPNPEQVRRRHASTTLGRGAAEGEDKGAFAQPPSISPPKGGGAIRGIGEKFAANPVTGTGSLSVPIATSPGRAGFGPQLALSYDSGAGNGAFGLGWRVALPAITRKTEEGLPRYLDATESDEFILSGAEDLVPVLEEIDGGWVRQTLPLRTFDGRTYRIQRYRPRIEGLFARVERWTNEADASDSFWRSISRDNITTWYGKTAESRVADQTEPSRIFSWLICESHDDEGNVISYGYKREDSANVDLTLVHEANRTDENRSANQYLKHVYYGNLTPYFPEIRESSPATPIPSEWMFEVVFDYGEHDPDNPTPNDDHAWPVRNDPFSSYRAGFELRTYRLCHRVLMFHHFPAEVDVGTDCLVRSTDLRYRHEQEPGDPRNPVHTVLTSVTQCAYRRVDAGYHKRALPSVEFEYSEAQIHEAIRDLDSDSLENLPQGLDNAIYQWVDLDGEGLSGILTQQGSGWYYKRNLSPANVETDNDGRTVTTARLAPLEHVGARPSLAALGAGGQQLLDLAGDGQLDLVEFSSPTPGFFGRTFDEGWNPFKPFDSLPVLDWSDSLRFVDLTGDGHADILITEHDAFCWYPSLGEAGFAPPETVRQALEEEQGPRLVFADGTQSIYLADFSGDGLTDLARIRNGEVCYWPNLGYGRFGAKVTMDNAPWFDAPDMFDQRRIRLADIDGSGVTDILYLGTDGVVIYYNQSGNSWSAARLLSSIPRIDNLSSVQMVDLLGNGTACLVWSSPLPGDAQQPMRYIDLMGGQKPHLMIGSRNNLGAETRIHYAPSTKFYLQDRLAGNPWITRIPFVVHLVERVETFDHISRNRFVTRYAYHHGYFDGVEREFRGFGMVEQFDTEEFAALSDSSELPVGVNVEESSHVPPVHTKTWFHTGVYLGRQQISDFFAGLLDARDTGEYYREPDLSDAQARELLLEDTVLPDGLTIEEEREACRALKGSMLRQEVYALDGTDEEPHPYTVTEQNFTIRRLQPRDGNRHGVFFTHAREAINYHYERKPADPRIAHAMTLEADDFGNVVKQVAIGYGRRQQDMTLSAEDQAKQTQILIIYTENHITNAIGAADDHRAPLPCETQTFELTGYTPTGAAGRFQIADFVQPDPADPTGRKLVHIHDGEVDYEEEPPDGRQRRLVEHLRTLHRPDDLGVSLDDPTTLLPLGRIEPLALPGETYKLAFTPNLLAQVYQRNDQPLMPDAANVLGGQGPDQGGYVDLDRDGHWWIPSGRVFYSPGTGDTAAQELAHARQHFFLPHRYRDSFGQTTTVAYDAPYDLLMIGTRDAIGNRVTVGERDAAGNVTAQGNDYRVLQPILITDPNGNRSAVAFDTLGMVVGTAVMGKPDESLGDSLAGFEPDLADAVILDHLSSPLTDPHAILGCATTRLVYDLFAYQRSKDQPDPQPAVVYTLARETHDADLETGQQTRIQHGFSYSDGFGLEIQKKIQAEPGRGPRRDAEGRIIVGTDGQPELTEDDVSPRWAGNGWTVFNNKGKPVRQYEPFFTDTHRFEFDVRIGVSPVLCYDPVQRVVATLNPNHTWQKVVFDPWRQETWDDNDTALIANPAGDQDVGTFFAHLPGDSYLPTWYAQRIDGAMGPDEQAAASKTAVHADTPAVAHMDSLGRTFLTVAHNKLKRSDSPAEEPPEEAFQHTRVVFDIEGNQREVIDALGRIVMRYDYDMLGNQVRSASMDAGERWMLGDVAGQPIRAWDSRGHAFRTEYDALRRPLCKFVSGSDAAWSDPRVLGREVMFEKIEHGEDQADDATLNLRTRVWKVHDSAGVVTTEAYDFKGNPLRGRRQLASDYKNVPDWSGAVQLEDESFTSSTTYDALNRPMTATSPDGSVTRPAYNEANLLERIDVNLRGETLDDEPVWTAFVTNVDYDAKGQRERIDYRNGASTEYSYDPLTFRLKRLFTRRDATAFPDDCPSNPPADWPGCAVQNLRYTYDPAGNITHIRDEAQQTIYFRDQRVEPSNDYLYDATYQLIEATGREHLGQIGTPTSHSHNDAPRVGLLHPGDGNAMGTYIERYVYDAVGNFLEKQHRGSDAALGWIRSYDYSELSLIEPAKVSNRLSSTTIGNGNPITERYVHDVHGNMTRMPHLGGAHPDPNMYWDYRDQLRQTDLGGGGTAYYVYNGTGQRARKVWEKSANLVEERLYLGSFEVFRRRNGAGAITLARETLHIMDDRQRIALVETRILDTAANDPTPQQLTRYQFGNHLDSASLELDDQAQIISYEEYTAYGSTSYQAVRGQTETPKRYRYTGKERDEETGLNYHGARYYACWLGRWCSADPAGLVDGPNLYIYGRNRPTGLRDSNGFKSHGDDSVIKDFGLTEEVVVTATQEKKGFMNSGFGKGLAFAAGALGGLAVGVGTAVLAVAAIAALPATLATVATVAMVGLGVAALGYAAYDIGTHWDDYKAKADRLRSGEATAGEWLTAGFAVGSVASLPFGGKANAVGKAVGGAARELILAEESAALNLSRPLIAGWRTRQSTLGSSASSVQPSVARSTGPSSGQPKPQPWQFSFGRDLERALVSSIDEASNAESLAGTRVPLPLRTPKGNQRYTVLDDARFTTNAGALDDTLGTMDVLEIKLGSGKLTIPQQMLRSLAAWGHLDTSRPPPITYITWRQPYLLE